MAREIDLKSTKDGVMVATGSVAVRRSFKNANGEYDTDFINFVAYRSQAEYLSQYAKTGDRLEIKGSWRTREFLDRNNEKRVMNECLIEQVAVFPKRESTESDDSPF